MPSRESAGIGVGIGEGTEERRLRWIRGMEAAGRRAHGRPDGLAGHLHLGIGDDAAVWTPSPGKSAVLTVDTQVEGVHFRRSWLTPRELGRRAVSAGASDIAAMAAVPSSILVSIVIEAQAPEREFREIHRGIRAAAREYGFRIIGGNLSAGPLSITVIAIGEGSPGRLVRRSGAAAGHEIWVTGEPGLARLGLRCLEEGREASGMPRRGGRRVAEAGLRAFRRPVARIPEALYLARRIGVSAMIDVSDGLATDLGRIIDASSESGPRGLGADLDEQALSGLPRLAPLAAALGETPASAALRGGDDYELCFTVRAGRLTARRAAAFESRFRVPLTRIGRITTRRGIRLLGRDGAPRPVTEAGWDHWG